MLFSHSNEIIEINLVVFTRKYIHYKYLTFKITLGNNIIIKMISFNKFR